MFSDVEENYIISLINTYRKEGFPYYIVHSITDRDNDYDICLYVSKEEIKEVSSDIFKVSHGIEIQIDSSSRNSDGYNPSTHSRDRMVNSDFSGIVQVDIAEFIYTNASREEESFTRCINPDVLLQNTDSTSSLYLSMACTFTLIITFLFTFFSSILRLRR